MPDANPPPKPPAKPAGKPPAGKAPAAASPPASKASRAPKRFSITTEVSKRGKKIVLYGTGGVGKTSLASVAPGAIFVDAEGRTGHVHEQGARLAAEAGVEFSIQRIEGIGVKPDGSTDPAEAWLSLRDLLSPANVSILPSGSTIVLDSLTAIEPWALEAVIAERPQTEKGFSVTSIEDYGYGKGYAYLFAKFRELLADLDAAARRGVSCVLICHESQTEVSDPRIGDFMRYEPRLYKSKNGNSDMRSLVKEWCDGLFFLDYDRAKTKAGERVASGSGTRTLYTEERPSHMAKGWLPFAQLPIDHPFDPTIWNHVFGQ